MTLEQALQAIAEGDWHDEGTQWRGDASGSQWAIEGENAQGVVSWEVTDQGGYGWITREGGWYKQQCDFYSYETLVKVARAMDAANKALLASLMEGR